MTCRHGRCVPALYQRFRCLYVFNLRPRARYIRPGQDVCLFMPQSAPVHASQGLPSSPASGSSSTGSLQVGFCQGRATQQPCASISTPSTRPAPTGSSKTHSPARLHEEPVWYEALRMIISISKRRCTCRHGRMRRARVAAKQGREELRGRSGDGVRDVSTGSDGRRRRRSGR